MSREQVVILGILAVTVAMFLAGRWRHDMVALGALLACVVAGLVPAADAFSGFGHPAVITVACVLVLSRTLQTSGAIDALARLIVPAAGGMLSTIAVIAGMGALLSAFMNNVGALALLMPVALQIAARQKLAPGRVLMPLAFGSILGGMTTLIGTPPNLIVSGFRRQAGGDSFAMFDFTPVGLTIAVIGVSFLVLVGWRFVPVRRGAEPEGFDAGAYLTEAVVPDDSKAVGRTMRHVESAMEEVDAQVIGLVRNDVRLTPPNPGRVVFAGDILILEADADALPRALSRLGLKLAADARGARRDEAGKDGQDEDTPGKDEPGKGASSKDGPGRDGQGKAGAGEGGAGEPRLGDDPPAALAHEGPAGGAQPGKRNARRGGGSNDDGDASSETAAGEDGDREEPAQRERRRDEELILMELAVLPESMLVGRSAGDLQLANRFGINVLAVSRQGQRSIARLRQRAFAAGDLLLAQGPAEALSTFAAGTGCVPLAARELRIPDRRRALTASAILLAAISGAAFGLLPAAIAFSAGVLASLALRTVAPRDVYDAVDWSVIVLLGALIPVAGALASTGTADLIARFLLDGVARGHAVFALALIMIVTMTLSDVMNNAATAAVMCPIAIGTAAQLGVSSDPFLMAVAVGAACAFLTPIGHQNNTLILGPGGFRFGDYWRLGLPLEIIVVATGVPMLLWVWPL